jgi:hypothetical protein
MAAQQQQQQQEPRPTKPGQKYGQLSPQGQWYWHGTGATDDHWAAVTPAAAGPGTRDVVTPFAALSNFAITILLSGSVTNPINSTSFQAVAPWGQGQPQPSLEGALMDLLHRGGSQYSGAMYNYFAAQTLNGATGSGPTGYTSANNV